MQFSQCFGVEEIRYGGGCNFLKTSVLCVLRIRFSGKILPFYVSSEALHSSIATTSLTFRPSECIHWSSSVIGLSWYFRSFLTDQASYIFPCSEIRLSSAFLTSSEFQSSSAFRNFLGNRSYSWDSRSSQTFFRNISSGLTGCSSNPAHTSVASDLSSLTDLSDPTVSSGSLWAFGSSLPAVNYGQANQSTGLSSFSAGFVFHVVFPQSGSGSEPHALLAGGRRPLLCEYFGGASRLSFNLQHLECSSRFNCIRHFSLQTDKSNNNTFF